MKYRNVEALRQTFFNLKTFGGGNIFEIDSTERRRDAFNKIHYFIHGARIDTDGETINATKFFE